MQDTKDICEKEAEAQGVEPGRTGKVYTPAIDIIERKDDIVVIADMPGVDEKSVDVMLGKNVLSIYGRVAPDIPEKHGLTVSEYGIGDYRRVFTISDVVDRDGIRATVKNGVLRLVLPKAEEVKTRKIEVIAE